MFFALSIVKNLNITRVSRFFKSKTFFSVKQFEKNGRIRFFNTCGALVLRKNLSPQSDFAEERPVLINSVTHLFPLGHVSAIIVAEQSSGLLTDKQVVFAISVVIAGSGNFPVFMVELTELFPIADETVIAMDNKAKCFVIKDEIILAVSSKVSDGRNFPAAIELS